MPSSGGETLVDTSLSSDNPMNAESMVFELSRELKTCGHHCYPSTLSKCCACEDLRPVCDEGYECYVDGIGYTMSAARDHGYCPVCNTKNYDKWIARVQRETEEKKKQDETRNRKQQEEDRLKEADRKNNLNKTHGTIEYTNGNIYTGHIRDGQPHGYGRMDYADNDDDILFYEGDWANGKHEGKGKKQWMDDLWYEGEWKNGMMHGIGVCHVNDVDVMKGRFEEDVFQD